MAIPILNPQERQIMREVNKLTASIFTFIDPFIQEGVTTDHIDKLVHDFIIEKLKARPAPLNYKGFPKSVCTSVNHVVCHGIPDNRPLRSGDILNLDVSIEKDGFYGDSSKMYCIGKVPVFAKNLVNLTQESLYRAIKAVKPGVSVSIIGQTIGIFARENKLSVVEEYCGHGIGRNFHQEPQIFHFINNEKSPILQPGMAFTIEPMLNLGKKDVKILNDGWTVITKDRSLSAQWEHTLLVTETGCEVLTIRPDESF